MSRRNDRAPADRPVLDLDRYVPFFLTAISNKWSRSASRLYLREFGVGIIDWRVMSMLAVEPDITANRVSQVIGMDKAAVSRSLHALEGRGLVTGDAERRRRVRLTPEGRAVHDRIIQVALDRERRLLADLSEPEVELLIGLLRRLHARMPALAGYDPDDAG